MVFNIITDGKWIKESILISMLFLFLIALAIASLTLGAADIPVRTVIDVIIGSLPFIERAIEPGYRSIILYLRVPRILLASIVGAALAMAGSIMQGLFKNPMADPYIIGVSGGAALGASLAIVTGLQAISYMSLPLLAFTTAIITVFVVYNIAREKNRVPVDTLLLAGIAVSFFLSAVNSFIMYFSGQHLRQVLFWTLGGFYSPRYVHIYISFPLLVACLAITMPLTKYMDAIMLGEEEAMYLGVEVELLKKVLLIIAALITAVAVAFSGVIGFVGLISPHIVRLIIGPGHRYLVPTSAIVGAIFLLFSDTLARTIMAPTEIPVGIITALVGAPFFIYLLWKNKRRM